MGVHAARVQSEPFLVGIWGRVIGLWDLAGIRRG